MDLEKKYSSFIDGLFELKSSKYILFIIISLGFILRLISAINLSPNADSMHFVTHAINFLDSGKLITYDQSSGLWFALTSLLFKIFGTTQIISRLPALIFGSLTLIIVYLLSKEFFNEKISLIAVFLLAISPFHIKLTTAEMDVMAMFLSLTAILLFTKALNQNKKSLYLLSGLFLGLAIYTKVYPLLFIPSFLICSSIHSKRNNLKFLEKDNLKKLFLFLLVIFIFTVPALTHNYLLYKDKGFLDLQFTRTLGLGKNVSAEYYSWDAQFNLKNSWKGLIFGDTKILSSGVPLLWGAINFIRIGDPLIFYLSLFGIISLFLFKDLKKDYLILVLILSMFILPFLASAILLPKHYVFISIFLAPLASIGFLRISTEISKISKKDSLKILIALCLLFSLFYLGVPNTGTNEPFYAKNDVSSIISLKNNFNKGSLIVSDSRIYRGRINWYSYGQLSMEGVDFLNAIQNQAQLSSKDLLVDVYYLECVSDDCGWGTVKDQPEFNQSMEFLTDLFKKKSDLVQVIKSPKPNSYYYPWNNKVDSINVYHVAIPLKPEVLSLASKPKTWFLYPIGYPSQIKSFDDYKTHGFLDSFLNQLAHWILKISLVLVIISIFYPFYLIKKSK